VVETSQLQSVLSALWQQLGSNPANRALVIARLLVNHADPPTQKHYVDLIERSTPPCQERNAALALITPKQPLSHIHEPPEVVSPCVISLKLRAEPEIGRLTIGLYRAAEYRVWIIGRDLTRRDTGSGKINKTALLTALDQLGIVYTRRHFNRLLKQGDGLFWVVYQQTIYLRSAPHVAQAVFAAAENRGLATETNLPGVRDVYVDMSGSLEAWEAQLYAGWIAYRGYTHDLPISRATLSRLFHRTRQTIQRWENQRLHGIVTKQPNYAQCPDIERYYDYIPDHAQAYVARIVFKNRIQDIVRLFWQLPNTYHSLIDTHPYKGQAARVRKAVNGEPPVSKKRDGHYRRYFTPEQLKCRHRSLKFRMGRSGDVNQPVYVFLGQHRVTQKRMFEVTNSGFYFTSASERVAPQVEHAFFARQEAKFERLRQLRSNGS
jgi:hypothetical protein